IEDAAVKVDLLGGAVHQSAAGGRPPRADPQFLQAAPQQVEVLLHADEHATRAPGQTLVHEGHRRGVLLVVRLEREAQVAAVANVRTDYRWTHANDTLPSPCLLRRRLTVLVPFLIKCAKPGQFTAHKRFRSPLPLGLTQISRTQAGSRIPTGRCAKTLERLIAPCSSSTIVPVRAFR